MNKKEKKGGFPLKWYYSRIYKKYDLVNRLFTLGLDKKWRKAAIEECLKDKPERILDLCCGTGDLLIGIASQNKDVEVIGYDFSREMLDLAKKKIKNGNLHNVKLACGEASRIPFPAKMYDAIGIAFGFRNLTFENPLMDQHVDEIIRVLAINGRLVVLESTKPSNIVLRLFFNLYLYFILVPLGTLVSGNFKAYFYLAKSSSGYYTGMQISQLLKDKGMKVVNTKSFMLGATTLIVALKQ